MDTEINSISVGKMKKILFTSFIVSLCMACTKTAPPVVTGPQVTPSDSLFSWTKSGSPVTSGIFDIWFTTNKTGFITNDTSLFTSTDNGVTWTPVANTTFPHIFNFQFVDDQNGFVQGDKQMGVTRDGGVTWSFNPLPTTSGWDFQFLTANTGFFYDRSPAIYKTSDAGIHWQNVGNVQFDQINCFYFLDSLTGFYMGSQTFNKTLDGGITWQKISAGVFPGSNESFLKMQFLDSMNGYSASPNGLTKTTDGGVSWTVSLPTTDGDYIIPYFFDVNNGYCIANSTIYKTTDGGQSWTLSCKLGSDKFAGLHMLDMNTGWAGTYGGYVLRLQ
jgi:photosystem II stability/assembly factor-like uncharacterized protein